MSLKEIFCQDNAISILQKALASDKSPHAYIFAGPQGVGKFKTAREWAKMLLCKSPSVENGFADSCSSCQSCRLFEAGSHPDFHPIYKELLEFTKDGKGKTTPLELPIDVIREFLIDKISAKPTLSQKKVFIVTEAEKLNTPSQNALLKSLEEPPNYCSIILLCARMERLLPTTKSRCQIIRFSTVDEDRIIDKLIEMGLDEKKAQYFARLAQGSLGQACQWAQLQLTDANLYQAKNQLLCSLSSFKYADSMELADWLLGKSKNIAAAWVELDKNTSKTDINRRAQKTLILIIISALLDAMKTTIEETEQIINFDQKEQIKKLAKRFNAEQLAQKIADAYKSMRWIESAVNEKLIFEQLLLNLAVSDKIKL
jgi:DNA polymerase-3 subunit delta'